MPRFKIVERFGDGGTYFLTEPEVWVEFLDAGTMPYKVLVEPLSEDIKGFLSFYHTAERTWSSQRSHVRTQDRYIIMLLPLCIRYATNYYTYTVPLQSVPAATSVNKDCE